MDHIPCFERLRHLCKHFVKKIATHKIRYLAFERLRKINKILQFIVAAKLKEEELDCMKI